MSASGEPRLGDENEEEEPREAVYMMRDEEKEGRGCRLCQETETRRDTLFCHVKGCSSASAMNGLCRDNGDNHVREHSSVLIDLLALLQLVSGQAPPLGQGEGKRSLMH